MHAKVTKKSAIKVLDPIRNKQKANSKRQIGTSQYAIRNNRQQFRKSEIQNTKAAALLHKGQMHAKVTKKSANKVLDPIRNKLSNRQWAKSKGQKAIGTSQYAIRTTHYSIRNPRLTTND
jgi:hypothetical protein